MPELQLALELLAAFAGGFFVATGAVYLRHRAAPASLALYDHDGFPATVAAAETGHWLTKGFVREWIAPTEGTDGSNL